MLLSTPRLVIAGLAGGSGKTLLSVGLARALTQKGMAVAPFKKGPDYIDAGWLGAAAGRCRAGRLLAIVVATAAHEHDDGNHGDEEEKRGCYEGAFVFHVNLQAGAGASGRAR